MKKIKQALKNTALGVVGAVASSAAFADTATAISDAITSGESNYSLVVAGVIGIAAIGVAVGLVLSMMRRS